MVKILFLIIWTSNFIALLDSGSLPASQLAEQTLITTLLNGYNKNIRPYNQVSVDMTAAIKQVISIDEKLQIMTSSLFISQTWYDDRLSWTPNASNAIRVVMLPVKSLWIPDTMILNSADTNAYLTVNDYSLASVDYEGQVYMILPALTIKTRCNFYVQKFPFDKQICSINLTSWSQGSNRIIYTENGSFAVDMNEYIEHALWKLERTNIIVIEAEDRAPFEYTENAVISIQLYLQRKPLFFMLNGIFACFVLNCVTLLSYALPFATQITLCKNTLLFYIKVYIFFFNLSHAMFYNILCLFIKFFESISTAIRIFNDDNIVFFIVHILDITINDMVYDL